MFRLVHRVGRLQARYRLLLALAMGSVAWWLAPATLDSIGRGLAAWDACAALSLLLVGAGVFTADAATIRQVANDEDPGRILTFVFVLVAAVASLLAVVALLGTAHAEPSALLLRHAMLSIAAVLESWLLVHTVFTLRYAHIFYDDNGQAGDTGGLEFPGNHPEPDYLDFAYFAFTIGTTAATSDVNISGRRQRRTALLHSLISFSFNTAIVALSISALGSLL